MPMGRVVMIRKAPINALFVLAVAVLPSLSLAQSPETFFKGQTINLVVGSDVGGGYDAVSRNLARHLGKHVVGKPQVIVRNMPGAGGLTHINYMFNTATNDGLSIGAPFNTVLMRPLYGDPVAKFDPRQFGWLGSTDRQTGVCLTWHRTNIKTLEDARQREVIAGSTALDFRATLVNAMLGTKFKVISGYATPDLRMAFERGEIESICGMSMQTHLTATPHWFRNNLVNVVVQLGLEKLNQFADVPLARDLITNEEDRQVFDLIAVTQEVGRPYLMPPGVPKERLTVLREGFASTLTDPEFEAESRKQNQAINPMTGAAIEALFEGAYRAPKGIIARASQFAER